MDPNLSLQIDPATGQPLNPAVSQRLNQGSSLQYDPATGQSTNPALQKILNPGVAANNNSTGAALQKVGQATGKAMQGAGQTLQADNGMFSAVFGQAMNQSHPQASTLAPIGGMQTFQPPQLNVPQLQPVPAIETPQIAPAPNLSIPSDRRIKTQIQPAKRSLQDFFASLRGSHGRL